MTKNKYKDGEVEGTWSMQSNMVFSHNTYNIWHLITFNCFELHIEIRCNGTTHSEVIGRTGVNEVSSTVCMTHIKLSQIVFIYVYIYVYMCIYMYMRIYTYMIYIWECA